MGREHESVRRAVAAIDICHEFADSEAVRAVIGRVLAGRRPSRSGGRVRTGTSARAVDELITLKEIGRRLNVSAERARRIAAASTSVSGLCHRATRLAPARADPPRAAGRKMAGPAQPPGC